LGGPICVTVPNFVPISQIVAELSRFFDFFLGWRPSLSCIFSEAIVLTGSRIWAFDWYQNRWPWMTLNGKMALILCYFTEFGSFGAHCVKMVDQAITMDNLRLLCLVVNVCRGTARRSLYKYFITARCKFCRRFINLTLNVQYLPSYHLDRKSHMSFRSVPKSVILNDIERRNGHYFALFYWIW